MIYSGDERNKSIIGHPSDPLRLSRLEKASETRAFNYPRSRTSNESFLPRFENLLFPPAHSALSLDAFAEQFMNLCVSRNVIRHKLTARNFNIDSRKLRRASHMLPFSRWSAPIGFSMKNAKPARDQIKQYEKHAVALNTVPKCKARECISHRRSRAKLSVRLTGRKRGGQKILLIGVIYGECTKMTHFSIRIR